MELLKLGVLEGADGVLPGTEGADGVLPGTEGADGVLPATVVP